MAGDMYRDREAGKEVTMPRGEHAKVKEGRQAGKQARRVQGH